jgi:hypothetical protein
MRLPEKSARKAISGAAKARVRVPTVTCPYCHREGRVHVVRVVRGVSSSQAFACVCGYEWEDAPPDR